MPRHGVKLALCLAAAFAAGSAFDASAQTDHVKLDSTRSRAEFSVKVLWLISISGRFGRVQGGVAVDRFRSEAVVDATIDADAVEMSNKHYEEWVKSDEFFDVEHHPKIHFVSESFPLQRLRNGGALSGTLTIRGIPRPAKFEFQPSDCERPAYDCPIRVEGVIHRSEFGMHSRRGTLSDKVDLRFDVYAVPAEARLQP